MRIIKWGVFFVAALAAAILVLQSDVARVQPLHDHFKTYLTSGELLPVPLAVSLTDQFGTVEGPVEHLIMFSNPVDKNGEGIFNPFNHLTWYDFVGISKQRTLLVSNQFGADQEWVVKDPIFLLLPAWKMLVNGLPTGHPPPSGLDHYLCYDVISGPPIGAPVMLVDQFHLEDVTVADPVVFCNPVEKTILPGGPTYDIIDPDNHLACYDINPKVPPPIFDVFTNDQFADLIFAVYDPMFLCVPSTKKIKPGGTCMAGTAEAVE